MAPIAFGKPSHRVVSETNLTQFTIAAPGAEVDRSKILLENSPIALPQSSKLSRNGSLGISRGNLVV